MASPSKQQLTASTSSSSILTLKSMIAEQKAAGKREEKKPVRPQPTKGGLWTRPIKGLEQRMAKDNAEWAKLNERTAESVDLKLRKKAEIYDKLQRGKTGGLTTAQLDNLLVDFDSREMSPSDESSEEEETELEPARDDPLVEITDEFGRTRRVRRSEVPREYLARQEDIAPTGDDTTILRGRHISNFPVYEPSAERVQKIMESALEDPLNKHYDAKHENRAKGAGFYQFSSDVETRQRQMEELMALREETTDARRRAGAKDEKGEEEKEESMLKKASAKRKRDLDERRALLDAKRRKKDSNLREGTDSSQDAMAFLEKMSRELAQ